MTEKKEPKTKKNKLNEKQIEELQKRAAAADEYLGQFKRLMAEFDNYKKRMVREQSNAIAMSSKNLIVQLLPIIDDLERALRSVDEGQSLEIVAKGVKLTHADIKKLLQAEGVEEIDPEGEEFNPAEHEAVASVESEEEENCIIQVMQKGYKINGMVIRPAMVTVSCKNE
jgi:molecular chaperone GrpE